MISIKDSKFTNTEILIIIIGMIGWLMEITRFGFYLKIKIEKFWKSNEKLSFITNNQKENHSLTEINEILEEMKKKKLNKQDNIDN